MLLNLLSNAIKFTSPGGRVDVRAAVNDALVEVSVADTGVGIAPEDREAVFEEFRQVGTAARKVEGTGLGLALSRKFIELHGGRIWVKSRVGQGSTFTFTIPARNAVGRKRCGGGAGEFTGSHNRCGGSRLRRRSWDVTDPSGHSVAEPTNLSRSDLGDSCGGCGVANPNPKIIAMSQRHTLAS